MSERIDVFPQVRKVLQSSDGQALASKTTATVTGSTGAESTGALVPAVTTARSVVTAAVPDIDASSELGCWNALHLLAQLTTPAFLNKHSLQLEKLSYCGHCKCAAHVTEGENGCAVLICPTNAQSHTAGMLLQPRLMPLPQFLGSLVLQTS